VIRALGEHTKVIDTLGINVYEVRFVCVVLSGVLAWQHSIVLI